MPLKSLYKNDDLIQVDRYRVPVERADDTVQAVRTKWATLREAGLAGDFPVEVLRGAPDDTGTLEVVNLFRWRSPEAKQEAVGDERVRRLDAAIDSAAGAGPVTGAFTQGFRGFNHNFPDFGAMELLNGVCACTVTIDGYVENFPMSVKNGIVLMHRSPGADYDGDGNREMIIKIQMHGGDLSMQGVGPIRVSQNFELPNDGLVRSLGEGDTDFPAIAVWRVHWAIETPMGRFLTDPDTPLIFGPSIVQHYPPVGTEFFSPTGTVKLVHQDTGEKVGSLTPRRLTAFDIVTTRDDQVWSDHLNDPPAGLFETLDDHASRFLAQGGPDPATMTAPHDDDVLVD